MKVTWLCLEWPRENHHAGGVGRYVARLASRMSDLVDLTVVAYDGAVPCENVSLVTLPRPRSRMDRYYRSPAIARAVVAATGADLIHAHGDDWLLRRDVPVVRSFYGSAWSEAKSSRGLRRVNHAVLSATEQLSRFKADVRLGIAPESMDAFNCDHAFPPYLRSAVRPTRAPSQYPLVVFIGSYHGRKRGEVVASAVQQLRTSGVHTRLVVVGPAADAPSWESWVEHRSGMSDAQVSALLSQAWLLAAPSTYEGFGIPILEALDNGVFVVASGNPGSEYIGEHGGPHLPLRIESDQAFAQAVAEQIARGPVLTDIEAKCADALVVGMTQLGSAERLESIYRDVLLDAV